VLRYVVSYAAAKKDGTRNLDASHVYSI